MYHVTKLVLPVAGLGKRLRPLTHRTPKNLIRLNRKPIIEYALEEASASGIREVVLIVSPSHRVRFERYLRRVQEKFPLLTFHIQVQKKPYGNGHAVLMALPFIRGKPFAIRFPDDIIMGNVPTLASLARLFTLYRAPVVLLERVPKKLVTRYGVVKVKKIRRSLYRIYDFIEKPKVTEAPSNLIVIGGYVLTPSILGHLKKLSKTTSPAVDSLLLLDALRMEVKSGKPIYGWTFPGTRLDCGTLEGLRQSQKFLEAQKRKRTGRR